MTLTCCRVYAVHAAILSVIKLLVKVLFMLCYQEVHYYCANLIGLLSTRNTVLKREYSQQGSGGGGGTPQDCTGGWGGGLYSYLCTGKRMSST